jgi:alpha-galactosidase
MWAMLAAPLLIGCDMSNMDEFTRALLTNEEVIEVDQDPLGKQATQVSEKDGAVVWSRPLWDGTVAVALFNKGESKLEVSVQWSELGLSGSQPVRDLWLKKDLGNFENAFSANLDPHSAVMLKIGKPSK